MDHTVKKAYGRDLLHRWEGNPVLTIEDVPFRANTVFNGTPMLAEDGGVNMLLRVEGQQGYSFFALARSSDGLHFEIDEKPVMMPAREGPYARYEVKGIEDPRATLLEGVWHIAYTAVGESGPRIALAKTKDHVNYERIGVVSEPGNKDGVLFPRKINGLYARLDRPIGEGIGCIWVSYSPDLVNWGRSDVVMSPRPGYWDGFRIGASVPPIELEEGWLEIYHGLDQTDSGPVYRVGLALLDLDNPAKVLRRSLVPIISPREDYERIGDVNNVCFACGAVISEDQEIKVYYGAADTTICVASGTLEQMMSEGFEPP
jgi:predicted GH43/DUF377 family glycosyl hydrolase